MSWAKHEVKEALNNILDISDEEIEGNFEFIRTTTTETLDLILYLERRITKLEKQIKYNSYNNRFKGDKK